MTKHSFSNSLTRYYSHLADSVLEPSLIKSALVYQYLYKEYFRSNTGAIQESLSSHDNNMGYVGQSLRIWRDSCVPGLGFWGIFFFFYFWGGGGGFFFFFFFWPPPPPPHHFSNGPSLRHIACDNQQRSKRRHEHRFRIVKQLPFRIASQQIQE